MKKAVGLLLMIILIGVVANSTADVVPTMDDPGELYCNDVSPTFVFHWKPNSEIKIDEYCMPAGPSSFTSSYFDYVYSTNAAGVLVFQPDEVIPGSGEGYVRVRGLVSDDGENSVWTNSVDCTFSVKAEPMIIPAITVPTKLEPGQDLVVTMPDDDMQITYTPYLYGRDTNNRYVPNWDDEPWRAGQTYTISGEYLPEADVYYLKFTLKKPRCDSVSTEKYLIAVGDVDIREPIYVYLTSGSLGKNALMLLHNSGIIQLKLPYTNFSDAYNTATKPSRFRMIVLDYYSYPSNMFPMMLMTGDIPDYFFAGASEMAEYADWLSGVNLLLQESQADAVSDEKRVGLYSMNHTLAEFYAAMDMTAPEPFDPVDYDTLGEITFNTPDDLEIIEAEAFRGIDAEVVRITDNVLAIRDRAFADSSLRQIIIPAGVTEIADNAFDGCGEFIVFCFEGSYAKDWVFSHRFTMPVKYGLID